MELVELIEEELGNKYDVLLVDMDLMDGIEDTVDRTLWFVRHAGNDVALFVDNKDIKR